MWGQFQHEVIAISSILIARFEMRSIEQVRWKKKKVSDDSLQLKSTYNKLLNTYKNISSEMVKNCIMKIYAKVYNGALFPYKAEIGDHLVLKSKGRRNARESVQILIAHKNY